VANRPKNIRIHLAAFHVRFYLLRFNSSGNFCNGGAVCSRGKFDASDEKWKLEQEKQETLENLIKRSVPAKWPGLLCACRRVFPVTACIDQLKSLDGERALIALRNASFCDIVGGIEVGRFDI
jgi:hypothetical protein